MGGPSAWSVRYPKLFGPSRVDYANADVTFSLEPVDPEMVTRLHLIARTSDGGILVCRSVEGWRFLPGGKREAGETLDQLASRELMEEAGADLVGGLAIFGAHVVVSRNPSPHLRHWPHPHSLWAYAVCRADVTGPPTSPVDGEQITDVASLSVPAAITYLAGQDRSMADVLALAADLGLVGSP